MSDVAKSNGPFELKDDDPKLVTTAKKWLNLTLEYIAEGKGLLEAADAAGNELGMSDSLSVYEWSVTVQWIKSNWTRGEELAQARDDARNQDRFRSFMSKPTNEGMPVSLIDFMKHRPDLAIAVLCEMLPVEGQAS